MLFRSGYIDEAVINNFSNAKAEKKSILSKLSSQLPSNIDYSRIQDFLKSLPESQRKVFSLRLEGMSFKEVSLAITEEGQEARAIQSVQKTEQIVRFKIYSHFCGRGKAKKMLDNEKTSRKEVAQKRKDIASLLSGKRETDEPVKIVVPIKNKRIYITTVYSSNKSKSSIWSMTFSGHSGNIELVITPDLAIMRHKWKAYSVNGNGGKMLREGYVSLRDGAVYSERIEDENEDKTLSKESWKGWIVSQLSDSRIPEEALKRIIPSHGNIYLGKGVYLYVGRKHKGTECVLSVTRKLLKADKGYILKLEIVEDADNPSTAINYYKIFMIKNESGIYNPKPRVRRMPSSFTASQAPGSLISTNKDN